MTLAALGLVIGAMALRTVGPLAWAVPACGAIAAFALPIGRRSDVRVAAWVLATGVGMVAVVAVSFDSAVPMPATSWGIVAAAAAGAAEEAIFRRGLYSALERWGHATAIVLSAAVFALVHVPVYGWRAAPLDTAAGLVFGWQRWTSGHWSSPAATHAVANVLAHV